MGINKQTEILLVVHLADFALPNMDEGGKKSLQLIM